MITLEKYKDICDGAPIPLEEFAETALQVKNCQDLVDAASDYLEAKEKFETILEKLDILVG